MNKAYRIVFECPTNRHINLQLKSTTEAISEREAREMFVKEEVLCQESDCGWRDPRPLVTLANRYAGPRPVPRFGPGTDSIPGI